MKLSWNVTLPYGNNSQAKDFRSIGSKKTKNLRSGLSPWQKKTISFGWEERGGEENKLHYIFFEERV